MELKNTYDEIAELETTSPATPVQSTANVEMVSALEFARQVLSGRPDRSLADDLAIQRIDLVLAASLTPPATPVQPTASVEAVAILRDLVSTLHIRGKMMTVSHDDLWALEKRARAYLAHPA
jgi:hypothetical protein